MSEHDLPATSDPDQKELPPIPDGGLGKGLPAWLESPPARPVKPTAEPTPIDLGALAGDAQLPRWLQDLSNRVDGGNTIEAVEPVTVEQPTIADQPAVESSAPAVPAPEQEAPAATPDEPSDVVLDVPEAQLTDRRHWVLYASAAIIIAALAIWLVWF